MMTARVAGSDFHLSAETVEGVVAAVDPEPIQEHYVIIGGRRYPPKQVLAAVTGVDRADFTTHQARAVLRRLGFGVYRRGVPESAGGNTAGQGPHGGAEAALLAPYRGRWVAQDGLEVLFDGDGPEAVVRWLRRHGRSARVWLVPSAPSDVGSSLSAP
jgi:hypothetical protein